MTLDQFNSLPEAEKELLCQTMPRDYIDDKAEEDFSNLLLHGQPDLELSATSCPHTTDFALPLQLFGTMIQELDFGKPFRVVIDYDPNCIRTIFHLYDGREEKDRMLNWREADLAEK